MMNLLKLAYNNYVTKKEPVSLIHFITNKCNARCKHCFIDFKHPDVFKGELTLQEIDKMTKHLGKHLFNVNLTGGEPFVRRDIFEIVRLYFKNTPIKSVYITSNGMYTQFVKEFLDKFLKSGIIGNIFFSISIDNFEADHDINRRVPGLYRNAMLTYDLVKSYHNPRIVPNISLTVTNHNYKRVISLYNDLKKKGVSSFSAVIMREEGVVKKIPPALKKKILDAYAKLTRLIHQDMIDGKTTGFGTSGENFQGLIMNAKNMLVNKIIVKTYLKSKYTSHCPAGALFGVIYANGDVYPCEILENKKLGNLRGYDMDFMKLWQNKATQDCKQFIKDIHCNCTFECAWSINAVSNVQHIPTLLYNAWKLKKWKYGT